MILIVGEIAFVGAALAKAFVGRGQEVVLYGTAKVEHLPTGVVSVIGEPGSYANLSTIVYKYKPDVLMYIPPKTKDVFGSYSELEDVKQLNATASSLVSLLSTFNVPRVYLVNSYEIYGHCSTARAKKTTEIPHPTTIRGWALLYLESLLHHVCTGRFTSIRLGELFGPSPLKGFTTINTIVESLVAGGRVGVAGGNRVLDACSVKCVVEKVAEVVISDEAPGLLNVGTQTPTKLSSIVVEVLGLLKLDKKSVLYNNKLKLPNAPLGGEVAACDLAAELRELVEFYRSL